LTLKTLSTSTYKYFCPDSHISHSSYHPSGKEGKGALLLASYEERFMKKELNDMPLVSVPAPRTGPQTNDHLAMALSTVSTNRQLQTAGEQAYAAWLGYYKGSLKKCGWTPTQLVETANQWARDVGLPNQPSLQKKTIGKMGLKGVPGLLIDNGGSGGNGRMANARVRGGAGGGPPASRTTAPLQLQGSAGPSYQRGGNFC